MKKNYFFSLFLTAVLLTASSCSAVGHALGTFFEFLAGAFLFGVILTVIGFTLMLLASYFGNNKK